MVGLILQQSDYNKPEFSLPDQAGNHMKTQTVSYMKEHANHLQLDDPLLITQNGKPKFVLQDAQDYAEQQQTLALLKLINLSEKSARQQGLVDLDTAFDG